MSFSLWMTTNTGILHGSDIDSKEGSGDVFLRETERVSRAFASIVQARILSIKEGREQQTEEKKQEKKQEKKDKK
jgi:hypothetical protein